MSSVILNEVPNVGSVVNRGQGFSIEVTINNATLWDYNDGKLILEAVEVAGVGASNDLIPISPGVSIDDGGQFSIDIPKVPKAGSEVVNLAFETDKSITQLASYDIKVKYHGYVGQFENILIYPGPPAKIYVENVMGPTWEGDKEITVKIHQE